MRPQVGLFRTTPLVTRWADSKSQAKCLYLALLPSGRFVRTLALAEAFDFGAYVDGVSKALERGAERVSVVGGQHFHHVGNFAVSDRKVVFTSRTRLGGHVFVQRWAVEVVTPRVLIGRGEVYRLYESAQPGGAGSHLPGMRP